MYTLVYYFQKRSKPNGVFKIKGKKPTEIELHLYSLQKKILFIIICTTSHNYFCGAVSMSCSQKKPLSSKQNLVHRTT